MTVGLLKEAVAAAVPVVVINSTARINKTTNSFRNRKPGRRS
jgi:hypothetical protein